MRKNLFVLLAMVAMTGCAAESPANFIESDEPVAEQAAEFGSFCWRPARAILSTLECVENEDAECAAAGYNPDFVKLHNGIDTNTVITGPEFWEGAFQLIDIELDYNHIARVSYDEVSIRYVEKVTFVTGDVFYQYEHALVTVDDQCRMILWDQYGDNKEQKDVDDKVIEIISNLPPPQQP